MSQSPILPHIYYTVSELASIKDVQVFKDLNVKTMGYINQKRVYEIDFKNDLVENSDVFIQLDLNHTPSVLTSGMKPYLIFGVLYVLNETPVFSVKTFKQLDSNFENLNTYHNKLLAVRKKSNYFVEVTVRS